MKQILVITGLCLGLFSCATEPVVQTGPNTYMISQVSAGGMFTNRAKLKNEVITRANSFAAEKGKFAEGISQQEQLPAPGVMPSYEYQFRLVDSNYKSNGGRSIPSSTVRTQIEMVP